MPALNVAGLDVPVALGGASRKAVRIGEQGRADDGAPISDVSRTSDDWSVRTIAMAADDADALRAVLRGAMPVSCHGDLLGIDSVDAVSCDVELGDETPIRAADGTRRVISFTLRMP
jgi:hypothetical protein